MKETSLTEIVENLKAKLDNLKAEAIKEDSIDSDVVNELELDILADLKLVLIRIKPTFYPLIIEVVNRELNSEVQMN